MKILKKKNQGQVMVISVLTLGGILLSAAGIAGLLLAYQIRASNDAVNSAKAFFAADAGIEAGSYCILKKSPCDNLVDFVASYNPNFNDYPAVYASATSTQGQNSINIIASGFASNGKVVRNLEASFTQ